MDLPEVDNKATGLNIKLHMDMNKLDAYTISNMLGLRSTTNIYFWMSGKFLPNVNNLVKLARIFNCRLDELIVVRGEYEKAGFDLQELQKETF